MLALATLATGGLMTLSADASTPAVYAARASVDPGLYYIGDSVGSVYGFNVKNTGSTTSIGAVEINRPTSWSISGCPTAPAGWTATTSTTKCRYRSAATKSDDIKPGVTQQFGVKARTAAGSNDRAGTWGVVVSSSNHFDSPSLLKTALSMGSGLTTRLHTFEVRTAVVDSGVPLPGSACPAENKSAIVGSTTTIVVCGRNHANVALTPTSAYSTLDGTYIAEAGTFSSGSIVRDSGNVVLANWVASKITSTYGTDHKVIAGIGSASNRTSPLRTFTGYAALSNPPDADNDAFSTDEDTPLTVTAPGVLANDSDPDGDPLTAGNASDPANGSVTLAADGSFTYLPDPDFHGVDSFTYTANDSYQDSAPATVTITVTPVGDAPVAADDAAATSEDASTTIPVLGNDVDVDGDTLAVSSVDTSGLAGQVTNNGTSVSYDPNGQFESLTTGQTATETFSYTVSDGALTDTATVTVTITGVNDAPVAVDDVATTDEDTPAVVSVLANDTDAEGAVTITAVGTATNGTATDNGNGTITFTPAPNSTETGTFTYTVTDAGGLTDTATVTVTVDATPDGPVAADDSASTGEDAATTIPVLGNDTDADGDPLTVSAVDTSGTAGQVTNNGTNVSYDPNGQFEHLTTGQTATDTFTYTVSDGGLTDSATVTVTITGVNDAPIAVDDSATTAEDTPVTVGVLTNDTDAEGPVTITAVSNATNGTATDNGNGTVTFAPAANFTGTGTFDYTITDSNGVSDTGTVTVTVTPVNDVPVANDDTATVGEDAGAGTIDVLANDSDVESALTVSAVDMTGTSGLVTNNGTEIIYDPNGMFEYLAAGQTATDTFTYTASDGSGGTDTATVTVTVTGANDAPVANDDSYGTLENTPLTVTAPGVLTNDTDVDDGTSKVALNASDPANGTVTLNTNGSFTYTPDNAFTGTDTFTYDVTDGTATDSATVTITVTPPNATPTANATSASGNEDGGAITVTLSGQDADGDALTFTAYTATNGLVTVPGAVTCTGATPNACSTTVTYTPNADFFGSDSFTYTVNDGTVDSAPATASVTVNAVNDAPSFTKGADQTVLEDAGAQTVGGWATGISTGPANESGQALSFAVTTDDDSMFSALPAVSAAGTLTYTPAVNRNGVVTVTVTATDDGGTANGGVDSSAPQTFTITVGAVNDAPSFTKGADQPVGEDAVAQSVSNWATAISKGPADESGQTLTFTVTNDNNPLFAAQPAVSQTGTLSFTPAPNKYGTATVTVSLSDDGGTANGGDNTSDAQTFTITVNAVNDAPVAAAKSFTVQTNMKISLGGLLTGATDPNDVAGDPSWTPSFTLGAVTAGAGCVGCTVSNVDNAAGTFDFEPPAGGTGSYTLSYTVVDNGHPAPGATSAPQTITLTVSGPVIWFVDGTTGSDANNGTLARPFATLGKAATVDAVNHRIFLASGTYSDGISLVDGEWLVGAGADATSFDALMGITPPAGTIARPAVNGTNPIVQGTVVSGSNNVLRGLTLSGNPALSGTSFGTLTTGSNEAGTTDVALSTTGQALSLSTGTIDGDFLSTTSSGGTNNVSLSTVGTSGTTSLGTGALSGATSEGWRLTGGAGSYSYAGTVANAVGTTVSVSNKTGGTVTFSGAVSDTAGAGVSLTNNTGSTISFTGGVNLTSAASPAFLATGGGTVSVTGAGNTLTSTTGTPLTVTDTTIGSLDLTFQSISANGAARGIYLSNTGMAGNLVVTGNAGLCTLANTSGCSGGSLLNLTGADDAGATPGGTGVVLNNTRDVSLTRMRISDTSNYGVRGTNVTNLTLNNVVVHGTNGTNAAGPHYEGGMLFDNLTGTVGFAAVEVSGGHSSNIEINNTSGTLNSTFTNLRLGPNSTTDGNDGLQVEGTGTAAVNVSVLSSTFTAARGDQFQYIGNGTAGGTLTFNGNTLSNSHPAIATGGGGISLFAGATGAVTMNVTNNTMTGAVGNAYTIAKNPGSGSITGTFTGNTIGTAGVANTGSTSGSGMRNVNQGGGTNAWTIQNNFIHQYNNYGMILQSGDGIADSGTNRFTVSGNTLSNPGSLNAGVWQGILVNSGVTPGDSFTTCVDFGTNTVTGSGRNGGHDVRVRQRQSTTVRLPGYAGAAGDTTAVQTFVQTKLGGSPVVSATADHPTTGGGFVGTAC